MKTLKLIMPSLILLFGLNSCEQNSSDNKSYYATEATAESIETDSASSSSDSILSSTAASYQDPNRKFIKTADVSMDVKNVYESTTKIESKVAELGGFVTQSQLQSYVNSIETFPINSDSAMEVKRYTVSNQMSLRIPQQNLATFLVSLGEEMKFLNHRNIMINDVSLNYELAKLEKERIDQTNTQLNKLNQQNGKIGEKKELIESTNQNKNELNQQKVNTLKLEDDVKFSTVVLALNEKEKIAETMIINTDSYTDKFQPDFMYSFMNSIKGGLQLSESLFFSLLYLWPLFILGILLFLFIRFQIKKSKIKAS